jgi:hypothetical protein
MSNDNELIWYARGEEHTKKRELVSWCGTKDKSFEFTNLSYSMGQH